MKTARALLTATALMASTAFGAAQQQYDSLGSPTPAPHQNAVPAASEPGHSASGSGTTDSQQSTTTGTGGGNLNAGTSTITDPTRAPDSHRQTNPKTQPSNTGGVDD